MSALPALDPIPPGPDDPPEAPAARSAPAALDVFCYRPGARDFTRFEARLRAAVAELGQQVRLVFASRASARPAPPAGVYLSPTVPTVVALLKGRLRGQAVGELPLWELRALIAAALGRHRDR
jgi:hypothetical protein